MQQDRSQFIDRMESFLSNPDAGMLRGDRRMGTELLLDMLADRVSADGSNVIKVKNAEGIFDHVSSKIISGEVNYILIYIDIGVEETNTLVKMFPDVQIYKAKELCHQVPVCYRETLSDNKGSFVCSVSR